MAEASTSKFHIAMFPWIAAGHMTPFLYFSNNLAKRGHRISFLLAKKAQNQLQHLNHYPNLISFHTVTIPHVDGLPLGTETASEIPLSLNHLLAIAMDLTRDQVESILSAIKPQFVYYDCAHWIPEVARKFGIKSICYNVVSAASLAIGPVAARNCPKDRSITEDELRNPPLDYPSSKVVLRGHEARSLLFLSLPFRKDITFYERIKIALSEGDAIAIRAINELEEQFCEYIAAQYQKPLLLSGPVLPEEGKGGELEEKLAKWLDRFEPKSVVYCAFGTQINLGKSQFRELLLEFEITGFLFLICMKTSNGYETIEEALPEGFEERVKERGLTCRGWVQQPLILSHPSVECFVIHCGFGSMWESLMSESQIMLIPHLGDQILNTRLLVEELKVRFEVQREENDWVSKGSLRNAIKLVMDKGSEVGAALNENHSEWKEILVKPGYMDGYIDRFIQNLQEIK